MNLLREKNLKCVGRFLTLMMLLNLVMRLSWTLIKQSENFGEVSSVNWSQTHVHKCAQIKQDSLGARCLCELLMFTVFYESPEPLYLPVPWVARSRYSSACIVKSRASSVLFLFSIVAESRFVRTRRVPKKRKAQNWKRCLRKRMAMNAFELDSCTFKR